MICISLKPIGWNESPFQDSSGACTVVGSIFLAADQLLRVEKLLIGAAANLVDGLLYHKTTISPGQLRSRWRSVSKLWVYVSLIPKGQDQQRWRGERICRHWSRYKRYRKSRWNQLRRHGTRRNDPRGSNRAQAGI